MAKQITTAFCVGEQWYEMPYSLVRAAQHYIGPSWTNSQIITWINERKDWYVWRRIGQIITIDYCTD